MSVIINVFVACTNLIALLYLPYIKNVYTVYIMIIPMIVSILMHLSETKHNLPGVYPFNLYSWWFLQLDRLVAIIIFLLLLPQANFTSFNCSMLSIGLLSMYLSENIENGYIWFATFHSIWHFVAYYLIYKNAEHFH